MKQATFFALFVEVSAFEECHVGWEEGKGGGGHMFHDSIAVLNFSCKAARNKGKVLQECSPLSEAPLLLGTSENVYNTIMLTYFAAAPGQQFSLIPPLLLHPSQHKTIIHKIWFLRESAPASSGKHKFKFKIKLAVYGLEL